MAQIMMKLAKKAANKTWFQFSLNQAVNFDFSFENASSNAQTLTGI